MVMHTKHLGFKRSSVPSNTNVSMLVLTAWTMLNICCATTDNTSMLMRLNSLKQTHAPDEAKPLKN